MMGYSFRVVSFTCDFLFTLPRLRPLDTYREERTIPAGAMVLKREQERESVGEDNVMGKE
jgi:hypothetical protein